MALYCRLSSEGRQRRIYTIGTSVPPKTIKEKKIVPVVYSTMKNRVLDTIIMYISVNIWRSPGTS
jgi:hypothetical protein